MIKSWSDAAWEDFEYWMKQDKKTLRRILQLLKDIDRNGYDGIVVIEDNTMKIVQCGSHYRDK